MADEKQDKKIYSRDLSVGLIQGMDRLSPMMIKTIDAILWLIAIFIGSIFLYLVAQILFFMLDISNNQRINDFEQFNKVLITAGSLIGALITLGFLVWRTMIAQKQNKIAQENIHSTTMAKAIEQLGAMKEEKVTQDGIDFDGKRKSETATNSKPNIEVRLGAIYLLEKLAREHRDLHWPIMEILCAYVRENAGPMQVPPANIIAAHAVSSIRRSDDAAKLIEHRRTELKPPRVDIQAAVTVIGRRSKKQRIWENELSSIAKLNHVIDLSNCNLSLAKFDGLDFSKTNFGNCTLESSYFYGANLNDTNFNNAYLINATFSETRLENSTLIMTHCEGAYFTRAQINNSQLFGSHFQGSKFISTQSTVSDYSESNFDNAELTNSKFTRSKLTSVQFNSSILLRTYMNETDASQASFIRANLNSAHLVNVSMHGADLSGALLSKAYFERISLSDAHLEGAYCKSSCFNDTSFRSAFCDDLFIDGADLSTAKNMLQSMFDRAWGNASTKLPDDIATPESERWAKVENEDNTDRLSKWRERNAYWLSEAYKRILDEEVDIDF